MRALLAAVAAAEALSTATPDPPARVPASASG